VVAVSPLHAPLPGEAPDGVPAAPPCPAVPPHPAFSTSHCSPHVEVASYTREHPSSNEVVIRCQTSGAISAEQGVVEALVMAKQMLEHVGVRASPLLPASARTPCSISHRRSVAIPRTNHALTNSLCCRSLQDTMTAAVSDFERRAPPKGDAQGE